MKKWANYFSNFLFITILLFLAVRFLTSYLKNGQLEGEVLPETTLIKMSLKSHPSRKIILGKDIKPPYIIIFWSAACPPCLVELSRLNAVIKDQEIPQKKVITINVGDRIKAIKKFMAVKNYHFPIYTDPTNQLAKFLKVAATPLTVHINKAGIIQWISTGISPTGIFRAKNLLSK